MKQRTTRLALALALVLGFVLALTPASAACLVKPIGGANTFTSSDTGSADDDLIVCETGDVPSGSVSGQEGDDTILVYAASGTASTIQGDYSATTGNDTITVFEDATVGYIGGDSSGSATGGNDQILLLGIVGGPSGVLGDDLGGGIIDRTGGDDIIDIMGVTTRVRGDGIQSSSGILSGGDDVITVHEGATANNVIGDDLISSENAGNTGGDDIITIAGTVNVDVTGDRLRAGSGGDDSIVVTRTGIVGDGTSSDGIYGDYDEYDYNNRTTTYGGKDSILVDGQVKGSIWGDYTDNGANDQIFIGVAGLVEKDIFGDWILDESGSNGTDHIEILGTVSGNAVGDGNTGDGARDYITVDNVGAVVGDLIGDGVSKSIGNASGASDIITIKGYVGKDVIGDGVDGIGWSDSIVVQGRDAFSSSHGYVQGAIVGDGTGTYGDNDKIVTTEYSQVIGGIFGDNKTRTGLDGGNDNILVDGRVGSSSQDAGVYGDKVGSDGGNDFLHVEMNGYVYGEVIGDDAGGKGGQDLIWIDGTVTKNVMGDSADGGNAKDRIAVRDGGHVMASVSGDGSPASSDGGWDTINISGGTVDLWVYGDNVGGNGGNDFMAIRMGGLVKRDFIGDLADGNGGNDTLSLINGTINRDMIGDSVGGNGGNDKLNVLVSGLVKRDVIGDEVGADKTSGNDSIFIAGKVNGVIYGDNAAQNAFAGDDVIQTSPSAVVGKGIVGDNTKGLGGNDTFKINGKINANGVVGDKTLGKGGNDTISIFSLGNVVGNVVGDDANGAGGNDNIFVDNNGKVTGNVWGDYSNGNGGNDRIVIAGTVTNNVAGDRQKSGSPNGGDDTIIIEETGLVQGSVFGDDVPGNGGDDKIDIKGKVNGNVLGDKVGGAGGNDTIRIFASATVGGNVCGKNNCQNNPGDNITFLDENTNPDAFSSDTIVVAGKVLGNVIAGITNGHSDDTVVVVEGAEIGGTVYAGDETNGDSFIYVENIINEEKTVSEVVNGVIEKDGKVTVNGVTYTLDDVEIISGAVGQISCFGMDYRMNKASDGCAARSGAEKDAIQWHLNNPGNDGRLPGLEGCAVYPYGDALRVYEIMNGEQGELVAEIWGDVLSDTPASNELLGATPEGNIALYHLASGELQIECRNLVDGKTQVRVLSDLAGTVTNAYDKG